MALTAKYPTPVQVKRLQPAVGDGGGGADDASAETVHTYVGQIIIPRSKASVREEKEGGVSTMTYRYVHLAADDNPGVTFDILVDDGVNIGDGADYLVREVLHFPIDGSVQLYVFNQQ